MMASAEKVRPEKGRDLLQEEIFVSVHTVKFLPCTIAEAARAVGGGMIELTAVR